MLVSSVKVSIHGIQKEFYHTSASVVAVFFLQGSKSNSYTTLKMCGISKRAFSHCESQTTVITYVEYLMISYLCKPYELAEM